MDLKTHVSDNLWASIETSYETNNFTTAIIDALFYLGDFIRERTGLQSDGVALIGQAFGGKSPKLRVNQLQTESELAVQKGTENLLTGLYQAIRNPRSHSKLKDSKEDADAIIIFVNYILKIIGESKGTFSKNEFIGRIFDASFVKKERYAQLLVEEIPSRYRLDIMIDVYRRKSEGNMYKLPLFTNALLKILNNDEIAKLRELVRNDLKGADCDSVRITVALFPIDFWVSLDESVRLRSEDLLLKSIIEGRYIKASKKCIKGANGTWARDLIPSSTMTNDYLLSLLHKLKSSDKNEQDYVLEYFSIILLDEFAKLKDSPLAENFIEFINSKVKSGDIRFFEFAQSAIYYDTFWEQSFKKNIDSFQETKDTVMEQDPDDIPF